MPISEHHNFFGNNSLGRYISAGIAEGAGGATIFNDSSIKEQYPPDLELEPLHLDIDLQFDLANKSASGRVTTTVKARHAKVSSLILNAVDFEEVNVLDPDGHELTWYYDGNNFTIDWVEPFAAAEQRRVEISYRVVEPVAGLYFSKPSDAYPDHAWYMASDNETERARHWLPCIDLPNVRTTLDFHLQAESRFTILANGILKEEIDNGDGTKTAHWKLEQLCPSYLVCIAIGDFIKAADGEFDDGEKSIEVAYFCTRDHTAEDLLRTFGRTKPMLAWITQKLGMSFPYPKYYQYAIPDRFGAMETISLVGWFDGYVQDETLAEEFGWSIDQLNVHEMSHSYFGDAIVCRDFAHAWLKESWATYIEQCWREDNYTQDEALYAYHLSATLYFQEADGQYKRPIVTRRFKSSYDMFDRHLYQGGACRLRTLCYELGDEVFWAAVRDYLQRYNGQVVETDHFRYVMEEHSGRSLGKFFNQWFYTAAYPDLKVSFSYDNKRKQGTFEIEQTQVDDEKNIPAFTLSTDLAWTIDGAEHLLPIKLDQAKHVITVTMSAEPEQVRFDPSAKILHKLAFNPGDSLLRKQLTEATDMIGRAHAAHELVKTGKRANIQAVCDAYADEPFWGVRREFAKALGEANSEIAIAGLVEIIASEQDPMALLAVFHAASNYRDKRIRDAIAVRLKKKLPYRAKQAAYQAMGIQREDAEWELLVDGIENESFNGIAQAGAFQGLASTRKAEAIDLLLERVSYGATSNRSRPAAVSALADIGQGQEKLLRERIVEKLIDLLRDPYLEVGIAAAHGLKTMKASEAIGALEAFGRCLSHQDRVQIERIIAALRTPAKGDDSALKSQVEELRDKVRKLEDQLQKLQAKLEPANAK